MEQRWLSRTGICAVLGITEYTLNRLVKQRCLVKIGKKPDERFLDPTSEYVEQLKLGQAIHNKQYIQDHDISASALFTIPEIAEILGVALKTAQGWIWDTRYETHKKFKAVRVGRSNLFPASFVRDLAWKRSGRKLSKQKSPFLVKEIIDFFWRYMETQNEIMPTDAAFEEDDLFRRKLELMMKMPSPNREIALADLMRKVELAKRVVASLPSARAFHRESDTHPQCRSVE